MFQSVSPNARAALLMVGSMAVFTLNDSATKLLAESMSVGQIILLRGIMATTLLLLLAWRRGLLSRIRGLLRPVIWVRMVFDAISSILYIAALAHMPLPNLIAIYQALPFVITMGAALFLAEQVGWRRWLAIAIGFAGVLIIIQPGTDAFNVFSMVVLASVVLAAVRDLITRRMPAEVSTLSVALVTAIGSSVSGALLTIPAGGITPVTTQQWLLLFGAAFFLALGYQMIVLSMRVGEVSFVAPFRYSQLLWGAILGFLVFGDLPSRPMLIGAVLIVGSGLYMIHREHVRRKVDASIVSAAIPPKGI
jgi:drug/metabolite transporter (DMT)-like permease